MEVYNEVKEPSISENAKVSTPKSRFRELMSIVINGDFVIESINLTQKGETTGYVDFAVSIASMGLNLEHIQKYKGEIFTSLFVDFISELIVRENIDRFMEKLSSVPMQDYQSVLGNRKHDSSGMSIKGNSMVFTFHLSLLQDILVSGFKKKS